MTSLKEFASEVLSACPGWDFGADVDEWLMMQSNAVKLYMFLGALLMMQLVGYWMGHN